MKKSELIEIIKEEIKRLTLKNGSIVKVDGIPVKLTNDTEIETTESNSNIIKKSELIDIIRESISEVLSELSPDAVRRKTPRIYFDRSKDVTAKLVTKTKGNRYVYKTITHSNGHQHKQWIKPQVPNRFIKDLRTDCVMWCDCLAGNSWILMSNGTLKQIKDIKPGDYVITHTGKSQKVLDVLAKHSDKNLFDMKITGFPDELTGTVDHKFYTVKGNEKCLCECGAKLSKDFVGKNGNPLKKSKVLFKKFIQGHFARGKKLEDISSMPNWYEASTLKNGDYLFVPWIKSENSNVLTNDKMFLLGVFLSEGSYIYGNNHIGYGISFTLNINEKNLAENISKIIKSEYNDDITVSIFETKKFRKANYMFKKDIVTNSLRIDVYSKEVYDDMQKYIYGNRAYNKEISEILLNTPKENIKYLLSGLLAGDGHIYKTGSIVFDTSSFNLMSQISTLLLKCNSRGNLQVSTHKTENKALTFEESHLVKFNKRRPMYRVSVYKDFGGLRNDLIKIVGKYHNTKTNINSLKNKSFTHDSYIESGALVTVKNIDIYENTDIDLYDLVVEEDNSFIANGVTVHNCGNFTYENEYAMWKANASHVVNSNGAFPKVRNPKLIKKFCKHLIACMDDLQKRI
jgi:hypothetical protein